MTPRSLHRSIDGFQRSNFAQPFIKQMDRPHKTLGIFLLDVHSAHEEGLEDVHEGELPFDSVKDELEWWIEGFATSANEDEGEVNEWRVKRLNYAIDEEEESYFGLSTFAACDSLVVWSSPLKRHRDERVNDDAVEALREFLELQSMLPSKERTIPIFSYGYAANELLLNIFTSTSDGEEDEEEPRVALRTTSTSLDYVTKWFAMEPIPRMKIRETSNGRMEEVDAASESSFFSFLSFRVWRAKRTSKPYDAETTPRVDWLRLTDSMGKDDVLPPAAFEIRKAKVMGFQLPVMCDLVKFSEVRIPEMLATADAEQFERMREIVSEMGGLIESQETLVSVSHQFLKILPGSSRDWERMERKIDFLAEDNERMRRRLLSSNHETTLVQSHRLPLKLRLMMCDLPESSRRDLETLNESEIRALEAKISAKERERKTMFPFGAGGEGERRLRCESSVIYDGTSGRIPQSVIALVAVRVPKVQGSRFVVFSCSDKTLRVVRCESSSENDPRTRAEEEEELMMKVQVPIVRLAFDEEDACLAVSYLDGGLELYTISATSKKLEENQSMRLERRFEKKFTQHTKHSTAMRFNNNSSTRLLAVASADRSFSVIETKTSGAVLRHVKTAAVPEALDFCALSASSRGEDDSREALVLFIRDARDLVLFETSALVSTETSLESNNAKLVPLSFFLAADGGKMRDEDQAPVPNILCISSCRGIPDVVAVATDNSRVCLLNLHAGSLVADFRNGYISDGFTRGVCSWSGKILSANNGAEVVCWDIAFPEKPRWRSGEFHKKVVKTLDFFSSLENGQGDVWCTGGMDGTIGRHALFF